MCVYVCMHINFHSTLQSFMVTFVYNHLFCSIVIDVCIFCQLYSLSILSYVHYIPCHDLCFFELGKFFSWSPSLNHSGHGPFFSPSIYCKSELRNYFLELEVRVFVYESNNNGHILCKVLVRHVVFYFSNFLLCNSASKHYCSEAF